MHYNYNHVISMRLLAFGSRDHAIFFGGGLSALGSASHHPLMLIVAILQGFLDSA